MNLVCSLSSFPPFINLKIKIKSIELHLTQSLSLSYSSSHKPVMVNGPSVKALVTSSANTASPTLRREAATPEPPAFLDDAGGGFVSGNGYVPTSAAILKNGVNDRGSHFTAVLK